MKDALKKVLRLSAIILAALFLGLNLLAFMQAWSMTHFIAAGERPEKPEHMSWPQKIRAGLFGAKIPKPRNTKTPADYKMEYSTFMLESGGPRLEVWEIRGGRTSPLVILFHGYCDSKQDLLPEAAEFRSMGCASWLPDFRGTGGSEGNTTTIGWHEAADVDRLVKEARRRYPGRKVVLFGSSMGAAAVLNAARRFYTRPEAVILEYPFDTLLHTVRNRFEIMGLPSFPAAELMVFWGGVQLGYPALSFSPKKDAWYLACPALVMAGEKDPKAKLEQVKAVFDGITAKEKEFLVFPGARHKSLLETDRERWRRAVRLFSRAYLW